MGHDSAEKGIRELGSMAGWPPLALAWNNQREGFEETLACHVASFGWQSSTSTPFGPISWDSLEEQEVRPDTSREELC